MKRWNWRDGERPRRRHGRARNQGSRDDQGNDRTSDQPQSRSESPAAPSSSSSSSSSCSAPELPGFYFDAEKNRYFRLLPGHNNCNPLTSEQLRQKESEKRRERSLAEDDRPRKKAPQSGLNMALLLQKRQFGTIPGKSYCRLSHEVKVSGMKRQKLEILNTDHNSQTTDNFRLMVGDSSCERVFTVSDVSHGGAKYGIMNFSCRRRGLLAVDMCDNLFFTNRKVNSVCWASVNHTDSHVLLCLVGAADTPGCVSLLPASLYSNSNPEQPETLCSFKIASAWSCAWCLHPPFDKTFSTGLSRRIIVKDAESGRTQTYSVSSDVLAQQFSPAEPVLFSGCRSGEIFGLDLRQRGRKGQSWKTLRLQQESAITSLRVLSDHNYLLAADMLGQIKLWDVRVARPVQQYQGHNNEHALLPVHVSEAEGLVLAVGQDCYTRLWSLQDGRLLRTIPSPQPAANDLIPSVVFSSSLGGQNGPPGLVMAVKNDLFYFPYNADS
ncbi:WD repeat domain 21 [Eucyclogobius newberryi]|uniref:WD repeat domain 21 n=1 Tax=Eucyclogobius newberryi TaxID=166745 RepID=UPI003B5AC115